MTSSDNVKFGGDPARIDIPAAPTLRVFVDRVVTPDIYPYTMSKILTPGQLGKFAIEKSWISEGTIVDGYDRQRGRIDQIRCNFNYPVVKLTENGNTWMSDIPFEVESYMGALEGARGDVLIGGLGIGLLPTMIKDKVTSIDIVELSQEVIDLVFHQVATEKMKIIHDDIIQYLKSTERQYDFICVDIWQDTFLPVYDLNAVKDLAQRCLKPGGVTWCWLQELFYVVNDEELDRDLF